MLGVRPGGRVVAQVGGEHHLGWPPRADGPGVDLADLLHPGRLQEVVRLLESLSHGSSTLLPGAVRVRHGDGRWVTVRLEAEDRLDDPQVGAWVLRLLPTADDAARTANVPDRFELLAEVVTAGILTADVDGQVAYANPAACELFWLAGPDLLGHGWLGAVHPDDRGRVRAISEEVRDRGATELLEFRVPVGEVDRWLRGRFNAIVGRVGGPVGWVAVFDDITADRATAEELARQATHDVLTGLPNRLLLEDRLDQSIARCRRHHQAMAVFFLDLDGFKAVNDEHGHHVGDQVLREVGRRIRRVVRAEDTAARLGGDEFVVVTEGLSVADARRVGTRLNEAVAGPVPVEGVPGVDTLALGVSVGVAWTERVGLEPPALLAAADAAMYEAKRTGSGVAFAPID